MRDLEIEIRNAVKSDWENMWELLQLRGGTDSKELAESRFISMLQKDEHFIPIAIVEGKAVGYGWVQDYGCHLRSGKKLCRFHDLFVRHEYRKKGIASALFAEIQSWAKEKGATWLQWNANPTSTHFYKKLGFTPIPEEEEGFPFFEIEFKENLASAKPSGEGD